MTEIKKYISANWIWIVMGFILTGISIRYVYIKRGYMAYGGEWLVLPLILMTVEIVKNIVTIEKYFTEMPEIEKE